MMHATALLDHTCLAQLTPLISIKGFHTMNCIDGLEHNHFLLVFNLLLVGLALALAVSHDLSPVACVLAKNVWVVGFLQETVLEGLSDDGRVLLLLVVCIADNRTVDALADADFLELLHALLCWVLKYVCLLLEPE